VQSRTPHRIIGLLSILVATIVLATPLAAAGGSGYTLSYTRAAGETTNANVNLISLSTSVGSDATVSVTFQVSGTLVLDSTSYFYWVFFGGGAASNATAYAYFTNSQINGTYLSANAGSYGYGPLPFTLGSGGSSLTFSINQSAVGPSSTFSANAWAVQGSEQSGTYSWIGTDYQGGSGSCTGSSCSSSSTGTSSSSALSGAALFGLIGGIVVVIIVVALVVVLVVLPRRKSPPQSPPPMGAGAPPPAPPLAPPPPQ
jgi:hypothetical protein